MRTRRISQVQNDDLVTLWHVGGERPCQGPALKVPPGFLESEQAVLPPGCELPDGSKLSEGEPMVCGTCGEKVDEDPGSKLALSRGRYR
jgi:hypothetical protein